MKKLLFIFTAFLLFSCSSSSDDNNSSNSNFSPPSWIQGTWGIKADGTTYSTPMYRFTTNNICQLSQATSLCWKESIAQAPSMYSGSDVSTSASYEANFIQLGGAVTITLKFKKISATKIAWIYNGIDIELYKL